MSRRALVALDMGAKVALIALLLRAWLNPNLPQYADKAKRPDRVVG